jgi:hypothetical protein
MELHGIRADALIRGVGWSFLDENSTELWNENVIVDIVKFQQCVDISIEDLLCGEQGHRDENIGINSRIDRALLARLDNPCSS